MHQVVAVGVEDDASPDTDTRDALEPQHGVDVSWSARSRSDDVAVELVRPEARFP